MKILIAIPTYDEMDQKFVGSLLNLEKPKCELQFVSGSLIYNARNNLCDTAIKEGFDYIFFLDSDIVFPKDTLTKLLELNKPVATGIYYKKTEKVEPVLIKSIHIQKGNTKAYVETVDKIDDKPFRVKGCGMGCCLIRCDVLYNINQLGHEPFYPYKGLGEDYSFCYWCEVLNYEIWAEPSIKLGHIGKTIYEGRIK